MPFSLADFRDEEIRLKITIILNDKNKIPILTKFGSLTQRQQKQYNVDLNSYIYKLPEENYLEKITNDFNEIVSDYFLSSNFKFEDCPIKNLNSLKLELTKEEDLDTKLNELEQQHSKLSL